MGPDEVANYLMSFSDELIEALVRGDVRASLVTDKKHGEWIKLTGAFYKDGHLVELL